MCFYFLIQPLCTHTTLLAGPSCLRVLAEFHRIHEEASAWTPEGRETLPFTWPDECLPHEDNVRVEETGEWCGWECQNSHSHAFGSGAAADAPAASSSPSSSPSVMGMPSAAYGVERVGVGWRDE